jgi:hypothetical protein
MVRTIRSLLSAVDTEAATCRYGTRSTSSWPLTLALITIANSQCYSCVYAQSSLLPGRWHTVPWRMTGGCITWTIIQMPDPTAALDLITACVRHPRAWRRPAAPQRGQGEGSFRTLGFAPQDTAAVAVYITQEMVRLRIGFNGWPRPRGLSHCTSGTFAPWLLGYLLPPRHVLDEIDARVS